jgi:hypothetical protein
MRHTFHYDPRDFTRKFTVPCSMGTQEVFLTREAVDVLKSKKGATIGCTNSRCAARLGSSVFGHKVYLVEFTKTSCYVVDKIDKNGQPTHCVWYKHNDGETIDLNDQIHDRLELIQRIKLHKKVRLFPPVSRAGQKTTDGTHPAGPRNQETDRRKAVPHGALLRAKNAGLLILQN